MVFAVPSDSDFAYVWGGEASATPADSRLRTHGDASSVRSSLISCGPYDERVRHLEPLDSFGTSPRFIRTGSPPSAQAPWLT